MNKHIFWILLFSLFTVESVSAQQCGEVTTLVADDSRIVSDLVADSLGNIYISQSLFGSTVARLTPDGELSTFIEELDGAGGLEVDDDGNLYVVEYHTQKVKKYNPDGELLEEWDTGMTGPTGIALDSKGKLYITNYGEFTESDGQYRGFGNTISVLDTSSSAMARRFLHDDRLNAPVDIEVDANDNLYIANGNKGDGRILRYSKDGELAVLAEASGEIAFGWIAYLDGAIYSTHFGGNTIYKTDAGNGTISVLSGSDEPGSKDGDLSTANFNHPNGISANHQGDGLYLTETNVEAGISRLRSIMFCD